MKQTNKPIGALIKNDAANYIGVSERYLDMMIAEGKLPKVKFGTKTVIRVIDLDKLLEANLQVTDPTAKGS